MKESKGTDPALLKRLIDEARPFWPHLAGIFALSMLAAPLTLLTPLPLMLAVDSVIGDKPLPGFLIAVTPDSVAASDVALLLMVVVMVVLVALLSRVQQLGTWLLQTIVGEKLALAFRAKLLNHAQRVSIIYHDEKGTSDAVYRIQYDAPAIQWVVVYGLTPFITASFTLVGMIYVTALVDWQLAAIALLVSPVLFFLTQVFRKKLRRQWREVKELETSALSIVQEVLGALRVVKAFGQEDREHHRFHSRSQEGVWARVGVVIRESAFNLSVGMTIALGTAAAVHRRDPRPGGTHHPGTAAADHVVSGPAVCPSADPRTANGQAAERPCGRRTRIRPAGQIKRRAGKAPRRCPGSRRGPFRISRRRFQL